MTPLFTRLWQHAKDRPDCVAFEIGDQSLTWAALAARVAGAAVALQQAPDTIGLALPNGPDYVIADLAATLAGKTLVPIPHFFGAGQIAHIIQDAGIKAMIGGADTTVPRLDPILTTTGTPMAPIPGHRRVIYTSGSSGQPKGVIIGASQITASLNALSAAVGTSKSDVYLSVLPAAQLLEQICGIFLPVMAGARTVFSPSAMAALFAPAPGALAHAFAKHRPTMSLLAPQLLAAWLGDIDQGGTPPPESLRFVALGGAPASPAMLQKALDAGIPVHEGYGLSEACSVVAMNRLGDNQPGTVGRVLDGLNVEIDAGEIVVSGPTVMQGYLHHPPVSNRWHTGDLGHFENGRLVIEGRKDNLIVTPAGRNISPEWVETLVNALPAIACSALVAGSNGLTLVIAPTAPLGVAQILPLLAELPDYARPAHLVLADPRKSGLIRPAGTPDRRVAQRLAEAGPAVSIPSQKEPAA
ncbi:MAG: AMP-binding protein [Rhodobacterales bacterium]